MLKVVRKYLIWGIFLFFIYSCAKVVAPTGGEKDETPPKVLYSTPDNMSTNFEAKKVVIRFDEFITLQNVTQELMISPIQEENPEVKLKNKNLIIEFVDTLDENVTYNLNFYNAIQDLNEGNVLKNYQYIFSTGNAIDTLFAVGHVYNAFNLEYEADVFVMLYKSHADSVPLTQKPYYITKTDEFGFFSLNSLTPGDYKLFALKDANRNMLFDQPSEPIAFIDSLVSPKVKLEEVFDTIQVFNEVDSTYYDSIFSEIVVVPATNELHLMLFTEDFENQFVKESKRDNRKQLTIEFNRGLRDVLKVMPLNFEAENWFEYERNKEHNIVQLWIKDSSIYKQDSVYLSVEYQNRDTLDAWVPQIDTINFLFRDKEVEEKPKRNRRRDKEAEDTVKTKVPSELKVNYSAGNFSEYDFMADLFVNFSYPLQKIDNNFIKVVAVEDTIKTEQNYSFIQDSLSIRKYKIETELLAEMNYQVIADSGAFTDIYNNINDSAGVSFRLKALEKYGTIFLAMENYEIPGVLQVLDPEEKLLKEMFINNKDSINEIKYLPAGKYRLKYFFDKNGNKKWDTGNYEEKLHPDPVYYYPQEIEIKENWDYEISWDLTED